MAQTLFVFNQSLDHRLGLNRLLPANSTSIPFPTNVSLNTSPTNVQQVQDAVFRALAQGLFTAFLDAIVPTLSPLGVGCSIAVAQVVLPYLITVALKP